MTGMDAKHLPVIFHGSVFIIRILPNTETLNSRTYCKSWLTHIVFMDRHPFCLGTQGPLTPYDAKDLNSICVIRGVTHAKSRITEL